MKTLTAAVSSEATHGRSHSTPSLTPGLKAHEDARPRSHSHGSAVSATRRVDKHDSHGGTDDEADEREHESVSGMLVICRDHIGADSRLVLLDDDNENELVVQRPGPIDGSALMGEAANVETARTPSPRRATTLSYTDTQHGPDTSCAMDAVALPRLGQNEAATRVEHAAAQSKTKPQFLNRDMRTRERASLDDDDAKLPQLSTDGSGRNILKQISQKLGQAVEKMSAGARNLLDRRSGSSSKLEI